MNSNNRIVLVDFLRGFALIGIVLIHCVEHFDFFCNPQTNFLFSPTTDKTIMGLVFLFISGKAYSIFALMFGFSFFIQMNRQENKGIDFRWRFLWRLTILLTLGFIHSLVYKGDILHIYALLGFMLVALYKVNTRLLIAAVVLLALQIPLLYNLVLSFINPDFKYIKSFGEGLYLEANKVYASGSFIDVMKFNLWKGRMDVWAWTYYNGRYLQLMALFIVGLLVGRKQYFEQIAKYKSNVFKLLLLVVVIVTGLLIAKNGVLSAKYTGTQKMLFETIFNSYLSLAYTAGIILIFIQVYLKFSSKTWVGYLANYGRMSLTNYITQAVLGVVFFYGFGFAMYRYLGSTWSLLYAFLFLSLQIIACKYWLSKFKYGPLEWFWRACTYLDFGIKIRKG